MISPARGTAIVLGFLVLVSRSDPALAEVANLGTFQVLYSDPEFGNTVRMAWEEPTPNPFGVRVFVDGDLLGTAPGGQGVVDIREVEAGARTFRVESANDSTSFSEIGQEVLAAQPFSDIENLQCEEGATNPDTGLCELILTWENPGPLPDTYLFFLDDGVAEEFLGSLDPANTTVPISGLDPGTYTVTVIGFAEGSVGAYRGQLVETTCEVTCGQEPTITFLRGDCDGDGVVEGQVGDAIFLLIYNFAGGTAPECLAACDADGDGVVEGQVGDAIYLLSFNFIGGSPPPAPFPMCGPPDLPSDETLGCETESETCDPPAGN